jgi:uncharacterized protein
MSQSETLYSISPDLVLRETEEYLLLVSTAFQADNPILEIFTASPTGRAILVKLDGEKTLASVIRELAADFEAPQDEVEQDVHAFIADLENKQILVRVDSPSPAVSRCEKPNSGFNHCQQQDIQGIKNQLGWAYYQLKWPRDEEIPGLSDARASLLESLSGQVNWSWFQNKIHYGPLSPGCICCGEGTWHCLFVNRSCTASCFYCPQNRKQLPESLPVIDEMAFRSPEDFAGFAAAVGARGISFSGGEPLLFYADLLFYIRTLREKLGRKVYLWMYTNGDLIDREKLTGLKAAGLDEIRVDISARDYSLAAVDLAREYFANISVEIPAIPEDLEKVKSVMTDLSHRGIHYLNLHQLLTTEYNYPALAARHYTFLHHPGVPVYESEITALKLLKHAATNRLPLRVNYCAQSYKERIHSKNRRLKASTLVLAEREEATENVFIRRITVQATQAVLNHCVEKLTFSGQPASAWKLDQDAGLTLTPALLPCLEGVDCRFTLTYYRPYIGGRRSLDEDQGMIGVYQKDPSNAGFGFITSRERLAEFRGLSPLFIQSFYRMIVQKETWTESARALAINFPIVCQEDINRLAGELNTLKNVWSWEKIETGLAKIY